MRGDAVFGDVVHLVRADLQFDALLAGADHGGVDRAIVVLLGRRDVILEAARHDRPGRVHDAERLIAIPDRLDDDAEGEEIGQLLEADRLALHLAPDRVRPLLPALHHRGDAAIGKLLGELLFDVDGQIVVAIGERGQPLGDDVIGIRIELAERQVLELLAHFLHAHAAGQRRIDIDRLFCVPSLHLRRNEMQRAHVVQTVGELHEQNAHIVGDREQELAEILRLLGFLGDEIELLQLGQAVDQRADIGAEHLVDLAARRRRILDRVVQQRGRDGGVVELQIGQDRRHFERMGKIRIARRALLLAMRLHGVDIGAVEQGFVGIGIVAADPVEQFVLPHDLRLFAFFFLFNGLGRNLQPLRSSGARVRDWFCILGNCGVDRTIVLSGYGVQRTPKDAPCNLMISPRFGAPARASPRLNAASVAETKMARL